MLLLFVMKNGREIVGDAEALDDEGNFDVKNPIQIAQARGPQGMQNILLPMSQLVDLLLINIVHGDYWSAIEVPPDLEAAYLKATSGIDVVTKPGIQLVRS